MVVARFWVVCDGCQSLFWVESVSGAEHNGLLLCDDCFKHFPISFSDLEDLL